MDATMLVAGGVVGAHGVGHVLGWLPALGLARFQGVSGSSWLLGPLGATAERVAACVAFGLPTVGFLAAVGAMVTGQGWFRTAAIASAVVSLVATAVFPRALPAGSVVGSVAVNAAVLVGLLATSWEPSTLAR